MGHRYFSWMKCINSDEGMASGKRRIKLTRVRGLNGPKTQMRRQTCCANGYCESDNHITDFSPKAGVWCTSVSVHTYS